MGTNYQKVTKERYYIFDCEFCSGEHCQPFIKIFKAMNKEEAGAKADKYFKDYYGKDNYDKNSEVSGDGFGDYSYFGGEVIVKVDGMQEINATTTKSKLEQAVISKCLAL